jgi:hypothetical protein
MNNDPKAIIAKLTNENRELRRLCSMSADLLTRSIAMLMKQCPDVDFSPMVNFVSHLLAFVPESPAADSDAP